MSDGVPGAPSDPARHLRDAIERAAHLLPAQGPIGVFIHHNTLHAFEDLPFDEAVRRGARVFGCEPYLSQERYRDELARGRIRFAELRTVLEDALGPRAHEPVLSFCTRLELRLAMLQYPLLEGGGAELEWLATETPALRRVRRDVSEVVRRRLVTDTGHWVMRRLRARVAGRPDWAEPLLRQFGEASIESWDEATWEAFTLSALWRVCQTRSHTVPAAATLPGRHRDLLRDAEAVDSDLLVHDLLIRLCAAFLDQGLAARSLPGRDDGLLQAFCTFARQPAGPPTPWLRGLRAEAARIQDGGIDALASIRESLDDLGVAPEETEGFVAETLLALRGWAGMIWHVENRADRVHHPIPEGSLHEYLAVRLLLERFALRHAARTAFGYRAPLRELRERLRERLPAPAAAPSVAFQIFQLAQVLGWTPETLQGLDDDGWAFLEREIAAFGPLERRGVFHRAYEYRLRVQALDALCAHVAPDVAPAGFQAVFCIDEREESIRRHLEEVAPGVRTFGAAGFFGVAMYFRAAGAADFVPLCPVVVRPRHWVVERVDARLQGLDERRTRLRRLLGTVLHRVETGSRQALPGAVLSAGIGLFATIPLVARVLFPRLTARFQGAFGSLVEPPPVTRLTHERADDAPGTDTTALGFSVPEMVDIAERLLHDIGLTDDFSRLVFLFGHGSTSRNNPHESAHDCGACGGGVGGPNARALAQMLDDPRVRERLAARGLAIPDQTFFVGGLHNTSSEAVTFYDLDRLPLSHRDDFERARDAIGEACRRNAHERTRRFESAPLTLSPGDARRHVEGRAEDLSQVRPEWGHATNALCVVGRRRRTRGLFLDRRSFLVSYDPTRDGDDRAVLRRILQAVVPVCSGINLEYYFSHIDSPGWGAGSKLPHNITSLLGVMDGAMSDLRTGLPWQMVEIHEPVRLLFVVEAPPDDLARSLVELPVLRHLADNAWVHLACLDPDANRVSLYRDGAFHPHTPQSAELPVAASSQDWYTGWRDHLDFARIVPEAPTGGAP